MIRYWESYHAQSLLLQAAALQSSRNQLSTPNAFEVNSPRSIHYSTTSPLGSLISGRVNNVEHHGKEKIANQNRQRRVYHRFSRGSADADSPFARGQTFLATDEHDEYSETECF